MVVSSSESHDLTAFYEMLSASFGVLSQNTGFYPSLDRIIETTLGPLNLGPRGGSYNEPISRLQRREPSFFLMKNTGAPIRDFDRWIHPFTKFSLRNSSSSFCSVGERGNVLPLGSLALGWSSMVWSHALQGGRWAKASSEKTSAKSL